MTPAARVAAAITVLDDVLGGLRAEQALAAWARNSRFAGSKDRAALRDLVFDALRKRASCAARGGGLTGRGLMVGLGHSEDWDMAALFNGEGHAPVKLSATETDLGLAPPALTPSEQDDLPAWLLPIWYADLGTDAQAAAQSLRARAPLFLRVNVTRGTVPDAIAALASEGVATTPHPAQAGCLRVTANPRRVKLSAPFADGLIEIQDAASQMAVAGLDIIASARVLDYCAGGGGKALALADRFGCEVTAHDIAAARMRDIPVRAARAKATITVAETAALQSMAAFDAVIVDAPCSGSGTWRRNPEAKWDLTPDKLSDFSALQSDVLSDAAQYLRPGGQLIYMTCSVFQSENDAVVAGFLETHIGFSAAPAVRFIPDEQSDGFFCQVFNAPGAEAA